MVFEFASQSGDCRNSDQQSLIYNNGPTETICKNTPSDTTSTSNTAVDNLPTVSFAGALSRQFSGAIEQQPVFRTAQDSAPPVPQPSVPGQLAPVSNPFKQAQDAQPVPFMLPEPSADLGQFRDTPFAPRPQPGPIPQPGPGPNPFKPIQPKPSPDSPDMRDKPIAPGPGPFAPAPMSASGFTADQVRSILSDRDRAIALNRGQKPSDKPSVGPIAPAPDGRNPFRPDVKPDKVQPPRTEFLNTGEFDEAIKVAKESGRPLIISFTKPGCGACTQIDNNSWPSQKGLVESDAIRAKVNGSNRRDLAQKYGVRSYPTTVVVNPNTMEAIDQTVGAVGSEELGSFLQNAFRKMNGGG